MNFGSVRFGPEPGRTGPRSGPKFGMGAGPKPKSGSRVKVLS